MCNGNRNHIRIQVGEQKLIKLSVVPDAILAITRGKLPDIRLVSANTETEAIGSG